MRGEEALAPGDAHQRSRHRCLPETEQPQTPSGSLENAAAQLPRTCVKCFRTRWSPDAARPAANSAIKPTMCSGLLQATVILTLVAHVGAG